MSAGLRGPPARRSRSRPERLQGLGELGIGHLEAIDQERLEGDGVAGRLSGGPLRLPIV
jgi:hypothetical protein